MKKVKNILLAACAALTLAACDDEKHVLIAEDMMAFAIEQEDGSLGIVPLTEVSLTQQSSDFDYEVFVTRNYYTGEAFPKQTAQVVITPETTAEEGVDFSISNPNIIFSSTDNCIHPFKITIHTGKNSEMKKIVLKLDYGYEANCPVATRRANILTITLNPAN